MIKSLLLTTLLTVTTGVSATTDAPLSQKNEIVTRSTQTRDNPNQRTYEAEWDYNFIQQVNSEITVEDTDLEHFRAETYNQVKKNHTDINNNNAWRINATTYTNQKIGILHKLSNNSTFGYLNNKFSYTNNMWRDQETSNNLFVIKLTPKSISESAQFTLNTTIPTGIDIINTGTDLFTTYYNSSIWVTHDFHILVTTDELVEQYVDRNITSSLQNYSWYQNILNNVLDYTDEHIIREYKLGESNANGLWTTSEVQNLTFNTNLSNLNLQDNSINYVVIFVRRNVKMYDSNDTFIFPSNAEYSRQFQLYDRYGSRVDGTDRFDYYWFHGTTNTLTGTYLINTNIEVIDLPDLMFTILGMPFQFLSTAFDVTLFPGTGYSFNIGNVILVILATFIFIFIIRLILRIFLK